MTAAEQDSVRIMFFYPDVLVGNSHPLRLPQLVNTRWGGNRNINIFRNLSFLPSATNIDVSSRGRGDESLTGEPARHLNLDDVENIIQGECSADGGTEREERAARLIHSAREALQLNSCYVPDSTEAVPSLFLREMLRYMMIRVYSTVCTGKYRVHCTQCTVPVPTAMSMCYSQ